MKTTMLSWVSTSETKGKDKEGSKPLVVVGYAYAVSRLCTSPKLTYITSTYSIGKERIVKGEVRNSVCDVISNLQWCTAIAHALDSKIYCDARKTAILKCQEDPELNALLTSNPRDAIVHLVPLSTITTDHLKVYLDRFPGTYSKVIGFRPTGWT
jgi:DNA cross-link repair 1A protein